MAQSDKLRIWLAENAFSSPLLVNGRCDIEAKEGHSPLSLVDAQLVKVFEGNRQAFVVKYFCSLHKEIDSVSPARMMASLIGELLTQMLARETEVDVSFLKKADLRNIERLDLDSLCNIFRDLTLQLPPKSVLLCVLDEVVLYETAQLANDMNAIIRRMIRLVGKHTEVVCKLLVTCQGRSLNIQKYFKDIDILDLPAEIEMDEFAMWKVSRLGESE